MALQTPHDGRSFRIFHFYIKFTNFKIVIFLKLQEGTVNPQPYDECSQFLFFFLFYADFEEIEI